jgi:hypothetical protein
MSGPCEQHHPDERPVWCDLKSRNHPTCRGWDDDLQEYVDWTNESYEPPKHEEPRAARQKVATLASRVAPASRTQEGFPAAVEASERSADTWDEEQRKLVFDAIVSVATRQDEFTTDEVWAELAARVPVTKGMTAMLMTAVRRDVIGNTGKTTTSSRGGEHDHGQRLAVWYSLIPKA